VEEGNSRRDSIGNFESQHCERRWESPLYYPIINEEIVRRNPQWLNELQWPDGKAFAACLTHDVDTVQIDSRGELARKILLQLREADSFTERLKHSWSIVGLRKRPKEIDIFSPWIELERSLGFRSSFFFSATKVSRRHIRDNVYRWDDKASYRGQSASVREVMLDIHQQGWDIGLHGSFLSALDYDSIAEQKNDLETTLGGDIYTTRQHNLHFDIKVTPIIQDRAGFSADSTLGFNRDIGFRAGIAYPFRLWDVEKNTRLRIFQIPLTLHDGAILRRDNLDLNETTAYNVCKKMVDRVAASKGVVTLLWHPDAILRPNWWSLYESLLQYIHEKNGWGASAKEIRDWWVEHGMVERIEKAIFEWAR
jgi:hypothetical protein